MCRVADMADVSGGEGGAGAPTGGEGGGVTVELGKRLADAPILSNISSPPTDILIQPPPPPTEAQLTAENAVLREQLAAFHAAGRAEMSSLGFGRPPPSFPTASSSVAADSRAHDCAQWATAIAKQYHAARICGLRLLSAADLANLHAALARATTSERLLNMAATLPESVRHAIFINVFPQAPHSWILGFLMAEATLEMDDSGSAGSAVTAPSVDDIVQHTDIMHPGQRTSLDIRAIFLQAFNSVTPARVSVSHGQPPPYQPPFGMPPLSHGSGPSHGLPPGHGHGSSHGPRARAWSRSPLLRPARTRLQPHAWACSVHPDACGSCLLAKVRRKVQ